MNEVYRRLKAKRDQLYGTRGGRKPKDASKPHGLYARKARGEKRSAGKPPVIIDEALEMLAMNGGLTEGVS